MAICRNPGGKERIGVHRPLWALERVRLRGICFSFRQLEFPFQIPFWLYDQATAAFMGGHSLAGGADLVRKNVFFPSKGSSKSSSIQKERGGMGPDLGVTGTWVWKLAPSLWVLLLILSALQPLSDRYGPFLRDLWLFSKMRYTEI